MAYKTTKGRNRVSESGKKLILCFDDTGSRDLTNKPPALRHDGMDCFGLGGVLMLDEDVPNIVQAHREFCAQWNIDYALHSSSIRGRRGDFGWLSQPENAGYFMPELHEFLMKLPVVVIGAIIDRPGYFQRYRTEHNDGLWHMDKTAFCILIERAAKYADSMGRQLEVFFEQTGRREDNAIKQYMRDLKRQGSPFDGPSMAGYRPLRAEDYRRIVLGEPRERTKKTVTIQIADLMLYPIAKGGYDPDYRPYKELKAAGRLIDDHLPDSLRDTCGIKYSCFENVRKTKGPDNV